MSMYVNVCMYACMHVCMYIYIYIYKFCIGMCKNRVVFGGRKYTHRLSCRIMEPKQGFDDDSVEVGLRAATCPTGRSQSSASVRCQ